MTDDHSRRRSLLTVAIGFALVDTKGKPAPKEVLLVREWLDNWEGLGHVVVGMERQGYALSLTKITDDGWRAAFHSNPQLSADGFATDAKPWKAVQFAAWALTLWYAWRTLRLGTETRMFVDASECSVRKEHAVP